MRAFVCRLYTLEPLRFLVVPTLLLSERIQSVSLSCKCTTKRKKSLQNCKELFVIVVLVTFGTGCDCMHKRTKVISLHIDDLYGPASSAKEIRFLTEELAVDSCREALRRCGFLPDQWIILEDNRSVAPNGRNDRYMVRNVLNPNISTIVLVNTTANRKKVLHVTIELSGRTIKCEVRTPK